MTNEATIEKIINAKPKHFTITEHGFFMTVKDGKIAIPKEVKEELGIEDSDIVVIKIAKA